MIRLSEEDTLNYRKLDTNKDFRYNMNSVIGFTLEYVDGYWEDVLYYGESFVDPTTTTLKPHFVYVMVNPLIQGVCKIGFTTTSVAQRVAELNAQTASIKQWYSVYSFKCPNGRMLEQEVHEYLENRGMRVNHKREGFEIKSEDAIRVIEELGQKYLTA
jgi:hypothetical protein